MDNMCTRMQAREVLKYSCTAVTQLYSCSTASTAKAHGTAEHASSQRQPQRSCNPWR